MRLGTYYRSLMLDKLGITANQNFVLDVGSFDGYWLSQQQHAKIKIAVDINPVNKYANVMYIKGSTLIAILAIFGILAYRIIHRKD